MNSAVSLHKYVVGLIGVMLLFAISYPIAFLRVSQTPKFPGSHLKSSALDGSSAIEASRSAVKTVQPTTNKPVTKVTTNKPVTKASKPSPSTKQAKFSSSTKKISQ